MFYEPLALISIINICSQPPISWTVGGQLHSPGFCGLALFRVHLSSEPIVMA